MNRTILKWAGSKARIINKLNLPAGKRLVEPFAGSCAVMMNTDYDEYLIADINSDLINMYQQIKDNVESFIELSRDFFKFYNNEHGFYLLRDKFNSELSECRSPLIRAVWFLYLNRHCFNGLCRYNKSGHFNVPFGKYKSVYFPENEIRAFAEKAQRATFICADWRETLQLVKADDVIYCDPPYFNKFTSYYDNHFSVSEQHELTIALIILHDELGNSIVVSNSIDAKSIYKGFDVFDITEITAQRSIAASGNSRKPATEIIASLFMGVS
ncbi:Dam family site-specific DNA-(adenine-N6)-methyltransferase [Photorhabdus bodei]|uniref:DNA adenine methylase n=1 Tax=Photorhabdus bodei TaxID=2029681 RepID=UPI0032B83E3E